MTPIVIKRPHDGIGDWLFALACCKYVNRQRPDVEVYVDMAAGRHKPPQLIRDLYGLSDVRHTMGPGPAGARATHDSLIYRKWPPDLYIESMVDHLNLQTGLGIRYEHGVYPAFDIGPKPAGQPYVVMIGHGKKRQRGGKEWGFANFRALAMLLRERGIRVLQIGAQNDGRLPSASARYLGRRGRDVVRILSGARAYVGVENGIMVLAGYLAVPQITLYDGHKPNPPHQAARRTDFEGQMKIIERVEPLDVANRLCAWMESGEWH